MKRVLLLGMILAICILAMPQGVLAAVDSVAVNANIQNVLDFNAYGPANQWTLNRGQDNINPNGFWFDVNSSARWTIGVAEAVTPAQPDPAHVGYMKEWGTDYVDQGFYLENSMKIQRDNDVFETLAASSQLVETGVAGEFITPNQGGSIGGTEIHRGFSQFVTLTDTELDPEFYKIVLDFTCTQTF